MKTYKIGDLGFCGRSLAVGNLTLADGRVTVAGELGWNIPQGGGQDAGAGLHGWGSLIRRGGYAGGE